MLTRGLLVGYDFGMSRATQHLIRCWLEQEREAELQNLMHTCLQAAANLLTVPNAYGAMLQRAGAVGLNASTSHDATKYFCSLPANKLELWFALEAERFQVHTTGYRAGFGQYDIQGL